MHEQMKNIFTFPKKDNYISEGFNFIGIDRGDGTFRIIT